MRSPTTPLTLAICGAVCLCACSLAAPRTPVLLATSLQELLPHGDRDHFVYVAERPDSEGHTVEAVQVEHVTALADRGEFEITLSENGVGTGRVRIRDDGTRIVVLSEDDLTRDLRLQYDPPLPYLEVPVVAGERQASATATVTSLSDGQPAGSLAVTQVVQVSAAPTVRTRLGNYSHAVALRTARVLHGPDGDLELSSTILLAPGIGEVRSDGAVSGAPSLHRELACAIIGGHSIGDCRHLKKRRKESQRARPTDVL